MCLRSDRPWISSSPDCCESSRVLILRGTVDAGPYKMEERADPERVLDFRSAVTGRKTKVGLQSLPMESSCRIFARHADPVLRMWTTKCQLGTSTHCLLNCLVYVRNGAEKGYSASPPLKTLSRALMSSCNS